MYTSFCWLSSDTLTLKILQSKHEEATPLLLSVVAPNNPATCVQ